LYILFSKWQVYITVNPVNDFIHHHPYLLFNDIVRPNLCAIRIRI